MENPDEENDEHKKKNKKNKKTKENINDEFNHKDIDLNLKDNNDHMKINYVKDLKVEEINKKTLEEVIKIPQTNTKEIFEDKIPIRKMKYPLIILICKLIFYSICLFSLYIIVRKILEINGFIIVPEKKEENKYIDKNEYIDEVNLDSSEMTNVKIQDDKFK